ncbi:hypothetical protein DB41_CO00020 [Neochlamydia sp. TUME1]|nr:hypothetical protein DB41_CO00020 [Neochlamydia sp. TUME1]
MLAKPLTFHLTFTFSSCLLIALKLNPVENLWHYLRGHFWSKRIYRGYKKLEKMAINS